jgi:hypothetical protein
MITDELLPTSQVYLQKKNNYIIHILNNSQINTSDSEEGEA